MHTTDAACGNVVFCAEHSAGSVFAQGYAGTRCTEYFLIPTAPRHRSGALLSERHVCRPSPVVFFTTNGTIIRSSKSIFFHKNTRAAVACGLGEIGWSKMLLTPDFGPLQRVAFLFTDAEFDEYDELYNGPPLCRKCGACVRECPGGCIPAINSGKKITVDLDGKILEWGDIDMWRCYAFYTHAGRYYNPFVPKEVWDKNENGSLNLMEGVTDVADEFEITKVYAALQKYFPSWVGYNMAKCGGCIRGCVSVLEKKGGCMEGRFKEPLRTKKAWKLDR